MKSAPLVENTGPSHQNQAAFELLGLPPRQKGAFIMFLDLQKGSQEDR